MGKITAQRQPKVLESRFKCVVVERRRCVLTMRVVCNVDLEWPMFTVKKDKRIQRGGGQTILAQTLVLLRIRKISGYGKKNFRNSSIGYHYNNTLVRPNRRVEMNQENYTRIQDNIQQPSR